MNTALVLHVPSAEPFVGDFRRQYDPSAADGMPAHVTLIYPFKPSDELTSADTEKLGEVCLRHRSLDFSFASLGRFPGVLWLAPEPGYPIASLAHALAEAFPDWPFYGGTIADFVPHLTLAHLTGADAETRLDQIEASFRSAVEGHLPIHQTVFWVSLFDRSQNGRWREVSGFPLGAKR